MQKKIIIYAILVVFVCLIPRMVQANSEDNEEQEMAKEPVRESAGITSIDAILMGRPNGRALATAAAYCVQSEQYDKAIKLSQQALDRNYDDNEIHQVYAEALEGKLQTQVDRDPALFNQCIKEWLIVLRQECGDEKLTYNGLGIPVLGKFYEDDERVIPARQHLMKLAGTTPRVWETDNRYLKRVTTMGANKVYGKIIPPSQQSDKAPEEK